MGVQASRLTVIQQADVRDGVSQEVCELNQSSLRNPPSSSTNLSGKFLLLGVRIPMLIIINLLYYV